MIDKYNSDIHDYETGTITKAISDGTMDRTYCYRFGNIVLVGGRIHSLPSTTVANQVFFKIPYDFAPMNTIQCIGGIIISGYFQPLMVELNGTGNVGFYWSASATTTQLFFAACYPYKFL